MTRIREAFSDAATRGVFRSNEIEIPASAQLIDAKRPSKGILTHVHPFYPNQIVAVDIALQMW